MLTCTNSAIGFGYANIESSALTDWRSKFDLLNSELFYTGLVGVGSLTPVKVALWVMDCPKPLVSLPDPLTSNVTLSPLFKGSKAVWVKCSFAEKDQIFICLFEFKQMKMVLYDSMHGNGIKLSTGTIWFLA